MIIKINVPAWNKYTIPQSHAKFLKNYNKIIANFERSCNFQFPEKKVLFLDNTYENGQQVLDTVSTVDCDIVLIISLLDPPYTWHYLDELCTERFPDKKFFYAGHDAPTFDIYAPWMACKDIYANYSISDVTPVDFKYVFLNYNGKPHDHRVKFVNKLIEHNLQMFGYYTLASEDFVQNRHPDDLGNMEIWNHHFLNITSETVFRIRPELLLSEKTVKPLIGLRPFVINGSPRYYELLQNMGIDCFSDLFPVTELAKNENSVESTQEKCHAIICDIIRDLSKQDLSKLYKQLYPRLTKNRERYIQLMTAHEKKFCDDIIEFPGVRAD
jgi:hypothetical protein